MSSITMNKLKDSALDVDPDVRFMALEDFKKLLNESNKSISVSSIEAFIPILFRLLDDANADVQSQAVKSFDCIVRYLQDDGIVDLLNQLFELTLKENEKANGIKSFTTSLPSMALRTIFHNHYKFSNRLARSVVSLMVPRINSETITIDTIEILHDIIQSLGFVLAKNEIYDIGVKIIRIVYSENGIISKRALSCFDCLLKYLTVDEASTTVLERIMEIINQEFEQFSANRGSPSLKMTLYCLLLSNVRLISPEDVTLLVNTKNFDFIFSEIVRYLKMDNLLDPSNLDSDDLDYDKLTEENASREDALGLLIELIHTLPSSILYVYIKDIIKFIEIFISYNPLNFENGDDNDISFSDDDDEIEFSDDDENNDYDESDSSFKLRAKSNVLIRTLLDNSPSLLTEITATFPDYILKNLKDKNDLVLSESINTLIRIIDCTNSKLKNSFYTDNLLSRRGSDVTMGGKTDPKSVLIETIAPELETIILNDFLVNRITDHMDLILRLIESMVVTINVGLSSTFLEQLIQNIESMNLNTENSMDFLRLYKCILVNVDFPQLPDSLITYVTLNLAKTISHDSSFYNVILEGIKVSVLLFRKASVKEDKFKGSLNVLINSIISKINDKKYSSELRQQSVAALCEFLINIEVERSELEEATKLLKDGLNYEITVRAALENLANLFEQSKNTNLLYDSKDFIDFLIVKLNGYISSSDDRLCSLSLKLFSKLARRFNDANFQGTSDAILDFMGRNVTEISAKDLYLSFDILGSNISSDWINEDFLIILIQKVINIKLTDIDDFDLSSYEILIKKICHNAKGDKSTIFDIFLKNLDLKLFVSAKTLSIITLENNLTDEISKRETEILDYLKTGSVNEEVRLLFNIQYLGNIGSSAKLDKIGFDDFLKFLYNKEESLRMASARSLGFYVIHDLDRYLPALLNRYEQTPEVRFYLLVAIKQIINSGQSDRNLSLIWNSIWNQIFKYNEIESVQELRHTGDILSKIILHQPQHTDELLQRVHSELSNSIAYTIIVVLKQLINHLDTNHSDILSHLLSECLPLLSIKNIEIKQVFIGTLLTGLHNKQNVLLPLLNDYILPSVFGELASYPEFKKVIPMGPYKYVVDEGLEIRKLAYEFLYAVISLDQQVLHTAAVNLNVIGKVIVDNGLVDNEPDIVMLSSITLSNLVSKENSDFLISDHEVLLVLIDNLTKNLSKKLKPKANSQETEIYEESLKSVIRLAKSLNAYLSSHDVIMADWKSFYVNMKSNYVTYFNAIDV